MIKGIMIGMLTIGGVVAALQPNNLSSDFEEEPVVVADTLDRNEVRTKIEDRLTKYVRKCVRKKDPHAFMTKCYSNVETVFSRHARAKRLTPIYTNSTVKGTVDFINCGQRNHVCEFLYFTGKDSLIVRESFLRDWKPAKKFTKTFCGDLSGKEKGGLF